MIRGAFGWSGRSPHPFARLVVQIPEVSDRWVVVDFLVDTGASHTCIHPVDFRRGFRLEFDEISALIDRLGRTPMVTAGGTAFATETAANIVLVHEDGRAERLETTIRIAAPSAANDGLPSLLGMDILQHYRLTITGTQSITLESLAELGLD